MLIPLVHGRAVRLTMRRLEAATPLSMAEIQADKDQLRAEFAMSTRRLEMSVEQMKTKTTSQLAELGKKNDAINRLKVELGEKTATIFALEAREKALKDQLQRDRRRTSVKITRCAKPSARSPTRRPNWPRSATDLDERPRPPTASASRSSRCKTQVDALKDGSASTSARSRKSRAADARAQGRRRRRRNELAEERGKVENLGDRVIGQLERQLVAQTTEAEILGRRVQDMEVRLAEQSACSPSAKCERDRSCARRRRARARPRSICARKLATSASRSRARQREPCARKRR